jgi:hypothetical protein
VLVTNTRRLLERSHVLMWATWRTATNQRAPLAGGAGDDAGYDAPQESSGLRAIVREALASGRLPRIKGHVIARPLSSGRSCAVCARPIKPPAPEYEVDEAVAALVAHWACYAVWLLESVVTSTEYPRPDV